MSALGTPEQLALEAKLIAMLQHPDLVAATERVRNLYLADPVNGATPAGTATAESAAANLVAGSTGHALVSDPARPVFFWGACAPHSWHGLEVPGSGYGIDNPTTCTAGAPSTASPPTGSARSFPPDRPPSSPSSATAARRASCPSRGRGPRSPTSCSPRRSRQTTRAGSRSPSGRSQCPGRATT